jgi:hypothetical protein
MSMGVGGNFRPSTSTSMISNQTTDSRKFGTIRQSLGPSDLKSASTTPSGASLLKDEVKELDQLENVILQMTYSNLKLETTFQE